MPLSTFWAVQPGLAFGRNGDATTLSRRVSAFLEWAKFTGAAYATAKPDFGGQIVSAGTTPSVGLYQRASVTPSLPPGIPLLLLLQ